MKYSFTGIDVQTGSTMFVSAAAQTEYVAQQIVKTNNPHFMIIDTVPSTFTNEPSITNVPYTNDPDYLVGADMYVEDEGWFDVHCQNNHMLDFPEISSIENELLNNQNRQYQIFRKKNADYGPTNILEGDPADKVNIDESLQRIYIRMQDKMSRLRKLISDRPAVSDETIVDTLDDIANYANIAIIVHGGKWGAE